MKKLLFFSFKIQQELPGTFTLGSLNPNEESTADLFQELTARSIVKSIHFLYKSLQNISYNMSARREQPIIHFKISATDKISF